jgi:hypothetical protein
LNIKSKAASWSSTDLLLDLYKFQSADELARADIPKDRLRDYQILQKKAKKRPNNPHQVIFALLEKLSADSPSDHFIINYKKGTIKKLK